MGGDAKTHSQILGGKRTQVGGLHQVSPFRSSKGPHGEGEEKFREPEGSRTQEEHSPQNQLNKARGGSQRL